MISNNSLSIENEVIKPSIEAGAFEALWAMKEVSSFKQIRDKLTQSKTQYLSDLVDADIAHDFYKKIVIQLKDTGITNFGVRIAGTLDYPVNLLDADYPLALLYYIGNWDLAFSKGISVVGTRNPSADGIKRAKRVVKKLVEAGFTIYSGLASGIDAVAHQTAIEVGGKTVAVIGTPIWLRYPKENVKLYEEISKNHLLISQVPIVSYDLNNIKVNRFFFPERNKTMSALSLATIIVEAGETSGTLIQAKAALKQGRKVFILNNNFEKQLTWPHKLQSEGAIRVHDIEDIFKAISSEQGSTPENR